MDVSTFSKQLFQIGAIKFGTFELKSGVKSPFYLDLRLLMSYPVLLQEIILDLDILSKNLNYSIVCGVPYAALCFSTGLALLQNKPMIMKRKEAKKYGTKQLIEGKYEKGDTCVVVEDVITSGASLEETIPELEQAGLVINDILVLVDRQQNGVQKLEKKGYRVHALYTMGSIIESLYEQGLISEKSRNNCVDFITQSHKTVVAKPISTPSKPTSTVYHSLLEISKEKQSNLVLSIDKKDPEEIFSIIQKTGNTIAMLKIHVDSWNYFNADCIEKLIYYKKKYNFLILEDRKFADIGNTIQLQVQSPIFNMLEWADVFTCHSIAGAASVEALDNIAQQYNKGIILIGSMSSKGALTTTEYLNKTIAIGNAYTSVIGIVAQQCIHSPHLLQFTPGVSLENNTDTLGQQYNTPTYIFETLKTDFAIVGRSITDKENVTQEAEKYQKMGWQYKN